MIRFTAEQIVNLLKQKSNLLRIEHSGNTQIWFSNQIPSELPIGNVVTSTSIENVHLPHNNYRIVTNETTGWMIFWKHLGPKCTGAGVFISVNPLNSGSPISKIELIDSTNNGFKEKEDDLWFYGFESQNDISYLTKGLTEGLLASYIGHPLADVNIKVLNILTHKIDTAPKAFEILGKLIMEELIFQLYKSDWIK